MCCLLLLVVTSGPTFAEAKPWLGRYAAGPDIVGFRWEGALLYEHGNISIPADGEWHDTVPEFVVRHRVSWIAERKVFLLDETHDRSEPWRYELRLDPESGNLMKVSTEGEDDVVVRTYVRETR